MKLPSILFTLIIACFLFAGCNLLSKKTNEVWFYTYSEFGILNDYIPKPNQQLTDYNLNPSNFICLQIDGSYTMDFGHFEYGTWELDDTMLVLKNIERKTMFMVVKPAGKEMLIKVPLVGGRSSIWHFEKSPVPLQEKADNPFSLNNNRWRLKARQKEDDEMIADRLRNHFSYWEKYFNWGLVAKMDYLDVRSLPGPLKIYGNGFVLLDYEKWPQDWSDLFYDSTDGHKAYDKLRYIFDHDHIAWAHTDNKYKMFISAFQQLQQKIK